MSYSTSRFRTKNFPADPNYGSPGWSGWFFNTLKGWSFFHGTTEQPPSKTTLKKKKTWPPDKHWPNMDVSQWKNAVVFRCSWVIRAENSTYIIIVSSLKCISGYTYMSQSWLGWREHVQTPCLMVVNKLFLATFSFLQRNKPSDTLVKDGHYPFFFIQPQRLILVFLKSLLFLPIICVAWESFKQNQHMFFVD